MPTILSWDNPIVDKNIVHLLYVEVNMVVMVLMIVAVELLLLRGLVILLRQALPANN